MTVGAATMLSRVLGFVRDILMAAMVGAGPVADAFFVAFKLPNLFRRLFAEGAFNAAFIPLFSGRLESRGEVAARLFAERVLSVLLLTLVILTVLAQLGMPWIMRALAPGFADDPDKFADSILFARIMFPYLLFVSLVALYGGILNSLYKFAVPAFAPVLLNIILIVALALIIPIRGAAGQTLSFSVAVAGVAQFLLLAYAAHRRGIRLRLPLPRLSEDVKRMLVLAVPGAIAGGIAQLNLFIGNIIASLQDSAISYLYYADRLYQLPLGVVGTAIGIVLLPDLSRRLRAGDGAGAHDSQNRAIEFAMLLCLPATVALLVIPGTIVDILFTRGAFSAQDANATAMAVAAFAIGLPGYIAIKLLTPAYFAREDTLTPLKFATAGVALNIALSIALFFVLGFVGIALATSAAAWLNAALLAQRLRRNGQIRLDQRNKTRLPRILGSAIGLGAALWAGNWLLAPWLGNSMEAIRIAALALLVSGGGAVYFACAILSGGLTLADLRKAFRRG